MSNSTSKYWFKRKRYGYGWFPVTWQGWLAIILYIFVVMAEALFITLQNSNSSDNSTFWFYVLLFVSTTVLYIITRIKGPSPRWRWGKKNIR